MSVPFCRAATYVLTLLLGLPATVDAKPPELVVPAKGVTLSVAAPLPESIDRGPGSYKLVEVGAKDVEAPAQLISAIADDGAAGKEARVLIANIPPRKGAKDERRFQLQVAKPLKKGEFEFKDIDDKSLKILDGDTPVMVYNHGTITGEHVPEKDRRRNRACYIHPVWGLNGEVLTDDFPKDHFHHHGIFWSWPHVGVDGKEYDMWSSDAVKLKFERWLCREAGPVAAVLGVENAWLIGDKKVVTERVWMRTYKVAEDARAIDLDFTWIPEKPISLRGAGGKSYGGLTVRLNVLPRRDAIITTERGAGKHEGKGSVSKTDLSNTPLAWADITTVIPGCPQRSGLAVFVPKDHPDYPPTWLTRHYGPLCVGWPGVKTRTFEPGKPIRLSYRILIHKKEMSPEELKKAYDGYVTSADVAWK